VNVVSTNLDGLLVLQPRIFQDNRGSFTKTFHREIFRDLGISFEPVEEFFSVSHKNVLRGMHFQLPPADHAKIVYCITGCVLDVVLDLRKKSETFGEFFSRELNAQTREILFIPSGFAHGFLSLENETTMFYQTNTVHSPQNDCGILWNSFGFDWPVKNPILSKRDEAFAAFGTFNSPF
jgi:dTDP-4-dehydrorhamnose 3,5-epimerase/CDP-3, 6-dideoxy-D-glycero-D-glycero-4-hexulose-5-epimerase